MKCKRGKAPVTPTANTVPPCQVRWERAAAAHVISNECHRRARKLHLRTDVAPAVQPKSTLRPTSELPGPAPLPLKEAEVFKLQLLKLFLVLHSHANDPR